MPESRPLILITGGAGFIGSHLSLELLANGYRVRILDNLNPQVHPYGRPQYLSRKAELVVGDVRNREDVASALRGVDAVCHLAAAVGVGQSMYEIERYTSANEIGTAVLLEALIKNPDVQRLVIASSMSVYGEGRTRGPAGPEDPVERTSEQMKAGQWELKSASGAILQPMPTPETKAPALSSIYALNKYAQERMGLIFGSAYRRPVTALRFFNVYGPNQALSNPYTGVLAIFASRLLNGKPPIIFEDGEQRRDFVHVRDVARACRLALERPEASGQAINIGSGESRSIKDVAVALASAMDREEITPQCTGKFRSGDIRHCFADISLARSVLGFVPQVKFEDGVAELADWLGAQMGTDNVEHALTELEKRGLVA